MSDLIDRQKAIEMLKEYEVVESDNFTRTDPVSMMTVATIANCIEAIVELPSAEPERTAKVIDKSIGRHSITDFDWTGKCENCKNEIQYSFDFCPYCGKELNWSDNEY